MLDPESSELIALAAIVLAMVTLYHLCSTLAPRPLLDFGPVALSPHALQSP